MNTNKPALISTSRLCLRALTTDDKENVCAILKNEQIAKTYMMPDFENEEAVIKLFEAFLRLSQAPDRFVYGIALDGKIIGLLNETAKSEDEMELGYLIHPDHWGRGYATEALGACIKALFDMGYQRVAAGYFEENIASGRVMEKCGMVATGGTEEIEYRGKKHRVILCRIQKQG